MADSRDQIFQGTASRATDFEFNSEVAAVFDDMLERSVPFYREQQHLIQELARHFWVPNTRVYDLGCSTGTTLVNVASALQGQSARLVGYDSSEPMVQRAKARVAESKLQETVEIHCRDVSDPELCLDKASVVTLCWTLQFVRPLHRDRLVRHIYESLVNGGAFIVTEKILTRQGEMNQFFIERYYAFKKRNGYTHEEIARKREALENVLVPFKLDENLELFRKCGFQIAETFFQWYNFCGFLCVKNA
ncbi:MAG: carboxy-S-adenosyl-L-methionine synthase CmoA [Candidatus Omnitrophica bacterium]|nr:carboxy-S-adenosyl-L-methionine synthase CmoA [Candidatus Omnitrophota bacterium]